MKHFYPTDEEGLADGYLQKIQAGLPGNEDDGEKSEVIKIRPRISQVTEFFINQAKSKGLFFGATLAAA